MWILLAATPVFADGGPHTMNLNNGSQGLAGDCAACHRAHQSTATDLLKSSQPGLCLSCHNGLGATADVVDGVQYTPTGGSTYQQTTVLGALRGGGFSYALLNTAAPDRLSYASRGGITVTLSAAPTGGSLVLSFADFPGFTGPPRTITITAGEAATAVQADATTLFGTDTTYSGSTSTAYMSGLPVGDSKMVVTKASSGSGKDKVWTFAMHDGFRLVDIPLPTVSSNTLTYGASLPVGVTVANGVSVGQTARVEALASGTAVTSTHLGLGTVWGNGAQGIGTPGATGVELECTNCHNPHGNGQYRILQTLPGEDWADGTVEATTTLATALTTATTPITVTSTAGFPTSTESKYYILVDTEKMYVTAGLGTTTLTVSRGALGTTAAPHLIGATVKFITAGWTDPTVDVEVIDGPALTAGQVHNYTVKAGYTTADVIGTAVGDYWRYKWDPSGDTNFTNFYLLKDPMHSGWNGQTPTNAASIESIIAAEPTTTLTAQLDAYSATYGSAVSSITVASVAGFPTHSPTAEPQPLFVIQIDSELMTASVDPANANTLKLSRGFAGTAIATHSNGATVTVVDPNAVDAAGQPVYNSLGRMTAFCIACHTRYNGWAQNGTSSLNAQTPMDAIFGYKHGTTNTGCEQCHVNHGTNAAMTGVAATVLFPDGTSEDSALLKVNNRGTCQLCHDPTGTIPINNQEGTVPGAITPQ